MDELGEIAPHILQALRQPLEEGSICVARARGTVTFPARVLLVAAMNPCPCGEGGPMGSCRCGDVDRLRYLRRLSGPLLDRFDLRIPIQRADPAELVGGQPGEATEVVAARVLAARELARERGVVGNAFLTGPQLERIAAFAPAAGRVLEYKLRTGGLTARGLHRVQRVARTVADLAQSPTVTEEHVCTALELRAELASLQGVAA
jgi:magnesium chelatase family protein